MSNFIHDNKDRTQRKLVAEYWSDRYARAEPIMKPAVGQFGDNYPRAGDEGLRLPWVDLKATPSTLTDPERYIAFKDEMTKRHENMDWHMKNGMPVQDKQRLDLTMRVEKAAMDRWEHWDTRSMDPKEKSTAQKSLREFQKDVGNLVEHDAKMGHPVADQSRNLTEHPYTQQERSEWMHRKGRQLTQDDVEHRNQTSMYDDHARKSHGEEKWVERSIGPGRFDMKHAWHNRSEPGQQLTQGDRIDAANLQQAKWVAHESQGINQSPGPVYDAEKARREKIGINLADLEQGKQRSIQR